MRIIKEGHIPNLEYVFACGYCGCEFAVTEYELFYENCYINKDSYKCPTCGTQVYGFVPQEKTEEEPTDTDNPDISEK